MILVGNAMESLADNWSPLETVTFMGAAVGSPQGSVVWPRRLIVDDNSKLESYGFARYTDGYGRIHV